MKLEKNKIFMRDILFFFPFLQRYPYEILKSQISEIIKTSVRLFLAEFYYTLASQLVNTEFYLSTIRLSPASHFSNKVEYNG